MTQPRFWAAAAALAWMGAALYGGSASANANPVDCHTSYMSGLQYTYCYYTDDTGYRSGTETICRPDGNCTTWEM